MTILSLTMLHCVKINLLVQLLMAFLLQLKNLRKEAVSHLFTH